MFIAVVVARRFYNVSAKATRAVGVVRCAVRCIIKSPGDKEPTRKARSVKVTYSIFNSLVVNGIRADSPQRFSDAKTA